MLLSEDGTTTLSAASNGLIAQVACTERWSTQALARIWSPAQVSKHMNFHNSAALKKIRVKRGTSKYKGSEKKVCRVAPTDHRQING
jgi:hypothetical protein